MKFVDLKRGSDGIDFSSSTESCLEGFASSLAIHQVDPSESNAEKLFRSAQAAFREVLHNYGTRRGLGLRYGPQFDALTLRSLHLLKPYDPWMHDLLSEKSVISLAYKHSYHMGYRIGEALNGTA